ncbi:AI-2E family transporter [Cellulomonas fengjieae]|uniref:AI-2E family transporter n=1 Tax=Cellulomonas fengjieae TaxID=2819978 RepID=A0ABS3SJX3_9CELL|nr:AI-2E family transporter [Cellulomonas fengjieae]MBO3086047.1 AI-2E family transporter [Cellulomonas fengjieae]QVI65884.1 AI-2E family transporter [Cellulomonas fengjieae]
MASPQGLAPPTRTLLFLASAVIVVAGLHAAREVLAPLFLATVLVIIVHPLRHPLERRGWPRPAATTVVIAVVYLILLVLVAMLVFAGMQFAGLVQTYVSELQDAIGGLSRWLASLGLDRSAVRTATDALQPSQLLGVATSVSGTVVGVASTLFVVVAYVIFVSVDAARYDEADDRFSSTHGDVLARATAVNIGVRRYFVVSASFGAVVAVIDGLALWALGVPAPAVWAILAFVTNFIPNIGFVIGVVPPALLALVVGGWPLALAVIAVYSAVNVVLQVLVQPKFVADAVNITLTLSFVSVIFWTFVIGPLGAILAVPLTLLARAVLLPGGPDSAWYLWLSGEDPPLRVPPPEPPVVADEAAPEADGTTTA